MNRKKVAKWLAAAGSLAVLTSCRGELVPYAAERTAEFLTAEPVILRDREAGRRFLMETVSAAEREGRQEIVVTGKDSSFDTLVIAQMFPGVVNISKLDLGTRNVNGETVTDCRIGFEWRGRAPDSGENTVPGTGDKFGEEEDRAAWRTGDVVSREIAGKVCRFRCIDDDYQDGRGSYGKRALFLAENVIRSDVDSTYEERILLPFGENNNYKKSRVREWLGEQAETAVPDASFVYTGALTAFNGKTGMVILLTAVWMVLRAICCHTRTAGTDSFCCLWRKHTGIGMRSGIRKEREVLTAGGSGFGHRLMRWMKEAVLYMETGSML